MKHIPTTLMGKLLIFYFCVMIFGVSILTLSNLYLMGWRMEDLLRYNTGAILAEGLVGTLFFQSVTLISLRNTRKLLKSPVKSEEQYSVSWNEMVHFPSRLFWGMVLFGAGASFFYHTGEMLFYGDRMEDVFLELAVVILFEQTLSLILGLLLFTGIRRILRPYVLQIPGALTHKFRKTTFYYNLLTIFCCLLIVILYSILWYVIDAVLRAKPLHISHLAYISLFDICFGVVIFSFFIREIRDDFGVLMEALSSLLKGSRSQLKTKVPIVSNNEIGNLGLIFNQLQQKVSEDYDEIETELQLACSIQQRLLPEGEKVFGPFTAAGLCKPCRDVGGDFFDIIPLDSGRFTIIIGDVVGKGTPAALIMSAALLLIRNEIHRGGTASEVLDRLNKIILGLNMSDVCLTLGIAVFDGNRKVLQYASAGHVIPYIRRKSDLLPLTCSSLPLGICGEELYSQVECEIHGNDTFFFYTDGIIDTFTNPTLSGFDVIEQILCSLDDTLSIRRKVDFILSSTEGIENPQYADDKTLVIVQYSGM